MHFAFVQAPNWLHLEMAPIGYIAYIDEAGDDGIRKLRTKSDSGASEWMVISAVLIKAEREKEVMPWLKGIIEGLKQPQLTHLHFYKLSDDAKSKACRALADREVRFFSVLSFKKSMEGRNNIRADRAMVNRTAKFYAWMSRLLLEEITRYCARRTLKDYGEVRRLRCEFSDRGGLNIYEFRDYFSYLQTQSRRGELFINNFDLDWSVMDPSEMHSYPNKMRAGLQLADIVASAFFCGLEPLPSGLYRPEYAKLLEPRMARGASGKIFNCGLKVMPRWKPFNMNGGYGDLISFYIPK